MTDREFDVQAVLACDPADAQVYEHGWQSWSPTGTYAGTATSPRPTFPKAEITNWRSDVSLPTTGFQGEGLVAVQADKAGAVTVFAASDLLHEVPSIRVAAQPDSLTVTSNGAVDSYVDDGPGGIAGALARWADTVVAKYDLARPQPVPPMWSSWYCCWDRVTDLQVLDNLARFDDAQLDVGIVQIDDGHQRGIGDWLDTRPAFGDLAGLAGRITATGRRAGIWTAPFLAGHHSTVWNEHPEWFVDGVDAGFGWQQDLAALDVTHPGAAAYLDRVFRTFRDLGFSLYKIDFLYAGALRGHRYEPIGAIEAYRRGLEIIRDAVGADATILSCGAPLFPSLGLVDVMRTSPDTASVLLHPSGDESMPSSRNALRAGQAREWQHGRFWINDPDCLIANPDMQEREQWAAWIARSCGLRASSDLIGSLDEWGLATTRRLLRTATPDPCGTVSTAPTSHAATTGEYTGTGTWVSEGNAHELRG